MRKFRIFMLSVLAVLLCGVVCNAKSKTGSTIEVVVFHGVKQCETCKAIKKNSEEVVNQYFKKPVKGAKVIYKSSTSLRRQTRLLQRSIRLPGLRLC